MTETIEVMPSYTEEQPRSSAWIWVLVCILLFIICCCCLAILLGLGALARFLWNFGDQLLGIESVLVNLLG